MLESSGGTAADSAAQGIGTLIHALAQQMADEGLSEVEVRARFAAAVERVDVGAGWFADRQRERAATMVDKLLEWLRDNPRELLAAERNFEVTIGRAVLSGQVDRLERDTEGGLVVVDLKTGKHQPRKADLAEHAQLGSYQLAVLHGAFDDAAPAVRESGGAQLVHLGGTQQKARVDEQAALSAESPESPESPGGGTWAHELVERSARGMAGSVFEAIDNDMCRTCPVRTSCPVQHDGRQVTA
jgi:RecB family exonuclease